MSSSVCVCVCVCVCLHPEEKLWEMLLQPWCCSTWQCLHTHNHTHTHTITHTHTQPVLLVIVPVLVLLMEIYLSPWRKAYKRRALIGCRFCQRRKQDVRLVPVGHNFTHTHTHHRSLVARKPVVSGFRPMPPSMQFSVCMYINIYIYIYIYFCTWERLKANRLHGHDPILAHRCCWGLFCVCVCVCVSVSVCVVQANRYSSFQAEELRLQTTHTHTLSEGWSHSGLEVVDNRGEKWANHCWVSLRSHSLSTAHQRVSVTRPIDRTTEFILFYSPFEPTD